MKLGVIGAMSIECEKIISAMDAPTEETVGGIKYTSGRIGGTDVVCAVCGVGKVFAAMCAQGMIIRYAPDCIINTGVGGSLTSELSIGDVCVADSVIEYDMDTSAIGDPVGLISGLNIINMPSDKDVSDKIMTCLSNIGVKCIRGIIATGDRFVSDKETKDYIVSKFSGSVCEMEGGAIGHVCTANNVPFAVIRAVSDNANDDSPMDFPTFAAMAAKNSAAAVIELAKSL